MTLLKSQAKLDNANILYIYIVRHLPVRRKRRKRKESANWRTGIWKRKRSSKSKMSLEIQHWKEGMLRSLLHHHQASNQKRRRKKSRARETRRTCWTDTLKANLWFYCNCCFILVITLEIDTFIQKLTSESSTDRVPGVSVVPSSFVQGLQVGVAETVFLGWALFPLASYVTQPQQRLRETYNICGQYNYWWCNFWRGAARVT